MALPTDFAPAERTPQADIIRLSEKILQSPMIAALDAVPVPMTIINQHRQVLFCNAVFKSISKCKSAKEAVGMRPGEALGCIHSHITEGGCGTSLFCRDCGAAVSIIKSLRGATHTEECRILRHAPDYDEALDLQVFTSPFEFDNHNLVIFTVIDISHEKRRKNLEHMFFHDILNIATGVKYASQMLSKSSISEYTSSQCRKINRAITQMTEEIQAQKDFTKAEEGTLKLNVQPASSNEILTRIWDIYTEHPLCENRQISISEHSENFMFHTDSTILTRILGNIVKNALEASIQGETITIGSRKTPDSIVFWGHNSYVMPTKIQRQVFKRSFTTKEEGRGIGTYSMKLLVEKYLKGQITFESTEGKGTIFTISLPEINIQK